MVNKINNIFKSPEFKSIKEEEYMKVVYLKFLESSIGLNSDKPKPLQIAILCGNISIVKYLLSKGCRLLPTDLSAEGLNCLELAISIRNSHAFYILLKEINVRRLHIVKFDANSLLITQTLQLEFVTFEEFVKVYLYFYI